MDKFNLFKILIIAAIAVTTPGVRADQDNDSSSSATVLNESEIQTRALRIEPVREAPGIDAIIDDAIMSEAAPMKSRIIDSLIRASFVGGATAFNLMHDPANPTALQNAVFIGMFAGTGSGLLQFFNHWYQRYIAQTTVTDRMTDKLPRLKKVMGEMEKVFRGYTADTVYVGLANVGIVLFSPSTLPTVWSYLTATFVTGAIGAIAQSVFEVSFAEQVRRVKASNPKNASRYQFFADKVTSGWSVVTSAAQVGFVMGVTGSKEILIGLTAAGITNFFFNQFQKRRLGKKNLTRPGKQNCSSLFN